MGTLRWEYRIKDMQIGNESARRRTVASLVFLSLAVAVLGIYSLACTWIIGGEFSFKSQMRDCWWDGDKIARDGRPWRQVAAELGYTIEPLKESGLDIHKPIPNSSSFGLIKHTPVNAGLLGTQVAGIVLVEFKDGHVLTCVS